MTNSDKKYSVMLAFLIKKMYYYLLFQNTKQKNLVYADFSTRENCYIKIMVAQLK